MADRPGAFWWDAACVEVEAAVKPPGGAFLSDVDRARRGRSLDYVEGVRLVSLPANPYPRGMDVA